MKQQVSQSGRQAGGRPDSEIKRSSLLACEKEMKPSLRSQSQLSSHSSVSTISLFRSFSDQSCGSFLSSVRLMWMLPTPTAFFFPCLSSPFHSSFLSSSFHPVVVPCVYAERSHTHACRQSVRQKEKRRGGRKKEPMSTPGSSSFLYNELTDKTDRHSDAIPPCFPFLTLTHSHSHKPLEHLESCFSPLLSRLLLLPPN
mmetsp:Transcript_1841/g.3836  ORF Transcript_1841/g.3836 Transcript_1841/m.3836 type:complete len:199 (+) Transcript_1841:590-1186(+)